MRINCRNTVITCMCCSICCNYVEIKSIDRLRKAFALDFSVFAASLYARNFTRLILLVKKLIIFLVSFFFCVKLANLKTAYEHAVLF